MRGLWPWGYGCHLSIIIIIIINSCALFTVGLQGFGGVATPQTPPLDPPLDKNFGYLWCSCAHTEPCCCKIIVLMRYTGSFFPVFEEGSSKAKQEERRDRRKAIYLDGDQSHCVWTPRQPSVKSPVLADVVMEAVRNKEDLKERQKRMFNRMRATQLVLKAQREELEEEEEGEGEAKVGGRREAVTERRIWQKAIKKVVKENTTERTQRSTRGGGRKRSLHFQSVVSKYAEKVANANQNNDEAQSTAIQAKAEARHALKQWRSKYLSHSNPSLRTKKPVGSIPSVSSIAEVKEEEDSSL